MILYTLAAAFFLGLMRVRVWIVPLVVIAAVVVNLGVGSGWNFESFKPFNNPIFLTLVLNLLLANSVACVIGYGVGRAIAFVMGWLGRNFRAPME
jgi:hypothetical protein